MVHFAKKYWLTVKNPGSVTEISGLYCCCFEMLARTIHAFICEQDYFCMKISTSTGKVYIGLDNEPVSMIKAATLNMKVGETWNLGIGSGFEVGFQLQNFVFWKDDRLNDVMSFLD